MPDSVVTPPAAPDVAQLQAELQTAFGARLQIVEPLGAGGMGHVFLARDPALKRSVAIKTLSPHLAGDETARQRFAREAQATAALAHPHVISIYEVGELPASRVPYFVMAFIEGDTMEKVIAGGPMSQPALRRLLAEVASALAAAHERGLVHRDIKPANIMLERGTGRAIVLDFGIAAASSAAAAGGPVNLTQTGTYIGTPTHMSPEQALGQAVTDRSDVYSLGLVAFEAASGQPTFKADTPFALIAKHIHEMPPALRELRPDMDPDIATLIDRCLLKDPEQRPTAQEISRQLAPESQAVLEWPPPGLEAVRERGVRVLRALHWSAAILVCFLLAVYLQPRTSTAEWQRGEGSVFWRAVWAPYQQGQVRFVDNTACQLRRDLYNESACVRQDADSTPLWFFMVTLAMVAFAASGVALVRRAIYLEREVRAMRRSGYPLAVLASAASDRHNDTANLINGLGVFAALGAAKRARFMKLRDRALLASVSGAILMLVFPVVVLLLMRTAWTSRDMYFLGTGELSVLLLPLLGYVAALVMSWPERQWKRAQRRALGMKIAPVVRSDIVRAWMVAAPDSRALPGSPGRTALFAIPVALIISVVAVLALTTAIAFSMMWSNEVVHGWVQAFQNGQPAEQPTRISKPIRMSDVDSALGTIASYPPVIGRDTLPGVGTVEGERGGTMNLSGIWTTRRFGNRQAPMLLKAARDTVGVPMYHVRKLAYHLSRGVPDSIAWRGVPNYQTLARHNETAAYLALVTGDTATALRRIRENLIIGRSTLRKNGPNFYTGSYGGNAAEALAVVSQLRGDLETAQRARAASNLVKQYRQSSFIFGFGWGSLLAANPSDTSILIEVGNRDNAPLMRQRLLLAVANGYCHNGRELFFGVSPKRVELFDRAVKAMSDVYGRSDLKSDLTNPEVIRARLVNLLGKPGVVGFPRRVRWCGY